MARFTVVVMFHLCCTARAQAKADRMHVMVVEDDEMMAATLTKGIKEDGYRVTSCGTATDALRVADADPADLVILDIGLPDRSGLDVLQALRSQKRHTPVIILTARDSVRDRVKGLDAGADDYLMKPFDRESMRSKFSALMAA